MVQDYKTTCGGVSLVHIVVNWSHVFCDDENNTDAQIKIAGSSPTELE